MPSRIFISYARKDHLFVDLLREDLDRANIDYWIDHEGIAPGTSSWERAIRDAINVCDSVLWIVSPSAYDSVYVRDEISIARMYKRKIYPIFVDGDNWLECVPLGTGEIQYIDARSDYAVALKQIKEALSVPTSEYVIPEEPTPVPEPGTEPRNPYKGLMAFMEADAGDFYGRETLIQNLQTRIADQLKNQQDRFLAVLGPSGAGKSSVVMAGLIPALKRVHDEWLFLPKMVPGKNHLEALAGALRRGLPEMSLAAIKERLEDPGGQELDKLARQIDAKRVVLYIDQFEELFTLAEDERERQQFISLITRAATEPGGKVIVLLSMRADFYGHPLNYPQLGMLVSQNNQAVLPMSITELRDAIEKPARLLDVALTFDDGLVAEVIFALREHDRAQAGALPLLQFTLERLFAERDGTHLTFAAYTAMGGVQGAIGKHSEDVFSQLPEAVQAKLGQVFLQLVNIDLDTGEPTRRRAALADVIVNADRKRLVDTLVENRLLQTGRDGDGSYLEIAHEALYRSWDRLKAWIMEAQEDLILLRQVRAAAADWLRQNRSNFLRWPAERLQPVYAMIERQQLTVTSTEQAFIEQAFVERPLFGQGLEQEYRILDVTDTTHQRRYEIGNDLARIGDNRAGIGLQRSGQPDISWLPVEQGGEVTIKHQTFMVHPFFIAKYPTTYAQFQAFVESNEYDDERWWAEFPEDYQPQAATAPTNINANAPRDSVSWYQGVAFARWLDSKYRESDKFARLPIASRQLMNPEKVSETVALKSDQWQIRLPTEWEWQWAAENGSEMRAFPWGKWDDQPRANTTEANIGKCSTAVGLYPHGAAASGALDMAGNIWEWCLNNYDNPEAIEAYNHKNSKVLRGGSFNFNRFYATGSYRFNFSPNFDLNYCGFRLVIGVPINDL